MSTSYHVYAGDSSGGPVDYGTVVATTSALTWTSGTLTYPSVRKYAVRAFDTVSSLEERNVDAVVQLRLDGSGVDVGRMPDAPTSISGVARAAGTIRVDWAYALSDPDRKPTGFHLYRGTGGTPSYVTPVATVAYSNGVVHFSADVAGGTGGTAYTFGARAYNATGEESNTLTTTVTAATTGPASVTGLSGTSTA